VDRLFHEIAKRLPAESTNRKKNTTLKNDRAGKKAGEADGGGSAGGYLGGRQC
jgi:hypothetical protein